MERTILHSDLNSFYASVECLYNPTIRDKPVSVCGSVDLRHGIVLASNPIAKKFGIKTGDAVWQAKQKCKELVVVDPHMDRYVRLSKMARDIYADYSPCVEPYGLDENWISLTGAEHLFGDGKTVADKIRNRVRTEMGLTVSIGVSFNKSLAKLGSDLRKPNFTNVISKDNFKEVAWPLPVSDLLFVGRATTEKLRSVGVITIGDLAKCSVDVIQRKLGKNGILIWQYANGIDEDPVSVIGKKRIVKSVGNSITTPRDLTTREDIRVTTMLLSESVAERMREKYFRCRLVQVTIRYSNLAWFQRQIQLPFPCCTAQRIGDTAYKLILDNWTGEPLRSLGVRGCDLFENENPQLSLMPDVIEEQRQEDLEIAMQDIRRRFGHFAIQRGIMVADQSLSGVDTRADDSAHTVAFYKGAS